MFRIYRQLKWYRPYLTLQNYLQKLKKMYNPLFCIVIYKVFVQNFVRYEFLNIQSKGNYIKAYFFLIRFFFNARPIFQILNRRRYINHQILEFLSGIIDISGVIFHFAIIIGEMRRITFCTTQIRSILS